MMRAAADQHGLLVVSEVMDPSQIEVMLPYVDVLQVGARNMQNYYLLRALGEIQKPVLLKRGMSATIEELLLERGIHHGRRELQRDSLRARHPHVRHVYAQHDGYRGDSGDQAAFAFADFADPSHGTGRRDKVAAMARAAVAAGADGLIIEVHQDPERALSRWGAVALSGPVRAVDGRVRMIAPAVGRRIAEEVQQERAAKN